MLKLMMDVKGGFTKKMLRKCLFAEKHFEMHDPSCPFISLEDDPITKTKVRAPQVHRCMHGTARVCCRATSSCHGTACALVAWMPACAWPATDWRTLDHLPWTLGHLPWSTTVSCLSTLSVFCSWASCDCPALVYEDMLL